MPSVRVTLAPRVAAGTRIGAVDELRGVAIALVVLYHGEGLLGDPNTFRGETGVDIFLILSGFALAMNSAAMPLRSFFARRFLRIYPAYWIALALTLLLQRRLLGLDWGGGNIAWHVVGLHGYARVPYFSAISDPFWFISMILGAYLAFACLRSRLDDLSLLAAAAGFLTVLATLAYQAAGNLAGRVDLALRIPDFFAGIIAGRLLCAGTAEIRPNLLLGLGLLCFYFETFFLNTYNIHFLPAVGIIAAWLGFRRLVAGTAAGRIFLAAFSLLGMISYEVYLFHQPIIRDYNSYVWTRVLNVPSPTHRQLLEGVFVGIGATLALSALVHGALAWAFSRRGQRPPGGTRAAQA